MTDTLPEPNQGRLFASVGHALSTWEWLELEMSRLYSHFVRQPDQLEPIQAFGRENPISSARVSALQKAGEAYFFSAPGDQAREFALRELIAAIRDILITRHQIAHSLSALLRLKLNLTQLNLLQQIRDHQRPEGGGGRSSSSP